MTFSCTLCGECCSGDMEVFLNSYDLYKMGRFLGFHRSETLFQRGRVTLSQGQGGLSLPKIRFKSQPFPFCPFLINDLTEKGLRGLCSLHEKHKPLVCALAPLSRTLDLKKKEEEFSFILPHPTCPGGEKTKKLDLGKVRSDWKAELDLEKRYYRLLEGHQHGDLSFLWYFSLEEPYDETLRAWERKPCSLKP